jgi:signal transduction histidine kinase
VTDTGIGIPAEHLPHIFERFYRVDAVRSAGGTGLGLAIARQLVEQHGGTITAVSSPGRGSTFTLRLPVDSSSEEVRIVSTSKPSRWRRLRPRRRSRS